MRAKRAEIFCHGGGPTFRWGGTQNFWDGGGQVLMGGDKVLMGGGPPPSPPIVDSPEWGYQIFLYKILILAFL